MLKINSFPIMTVMKKLTLDGREVKIAVRCWGLIAYLWSKLWHQMAETNSLAMTTKLDTGNNRFWVYSGHTRDIDPRLLSATAGMSLSVCDQTTNDWTDKVWSWMHTHFRWTLRAAAEGRRLIQEVRISHLVKLQLSSLNARGRKRMH